MKFIQNSLKLSLKMGVRHFKALLKEIYRTEREVAKDIVGVTAKTRVKFTVTERVFVTSSYQPTKLSPFRLKAKFVANTLRFVTNNGRIISPSRALFEHFSQNSSHTKDDNAVKLRKQ